VKFAAESAMARRAFGASSTGAAPASTGRSATTATAPARAASSAVVAVGARAPEREEERAWRPRASRGA
jgi:hypothetical protein